MEGSVIVGMRSCIGTCSHVSRNDGKLVQTDEQPVRNEEALSSTPAGGEQKGEFFGAPQAPAIFSPRNVKQVLSVCPRRGL